MNEIHRTSGIHEIYSFEVDEFDFICGEACGGKTLQGTDSMAEHQPTPFKAMFSDAKTHSLFQQLLDHVRTTAETISFPFRCDTDTHSVYLRALVFESSSSRVGFHNKIIGYDPRPLDTRLLRVFGGENPDYETCSICNRMNNAGTWLEFQQMVDLQIWPANDKVMRCAYDTCTECERGIRQRMRETTRSHTKLTS